MNNGILCICLLIFIALGLIAVWTITSVREVKRKKGCQDFELKNRQGIIVRLPLVPENHEVQLCTGSYTGVALSSSIKGFKDAEGWKGIIPFGLIQTDSESWFAAQVPDNTKLLIMSIHQKDMVLATLVFKDGKAGPIRFIRSDGPAVTFINIDKISALARTGETP